MSPASEILHYPLAVALFIFMVASFDKGLTPGSMKYTSRASLWVNRPGFRGGCLVKVKPGFRSSRRVADSSLPQPGPVEYTQAGSSSRWWLNQDTHSRVASSSDSFVSMEHGGG